LTLAEWTRLPLVPLTMRRYVPRGVVLRVRTVSTDVPEFTTETGLNLAVAFCGKPLAEKLTVPENPAPAAIVTVYVAFPPRATVTLDGVAETEKSPVTTSVTLTVWESDPLVAVIASV
jgi:hypothetical protein